jgi:formylglycine-generating enzyme required for sulfatase activity
MSFFGLINSLGMEFVLIPAGTFRMGSDDGNSEEKPCHEVEISRPFYLGRYKVTQAQWQAVMEKGLPGWNNPSCFKGANLPVECVTWYETQEFILRLNREEGHNRYRLPTEAEWEYACRAGSTGRYCFGDDENLLEDYAWYAGNSRGETHPVGRKRPNAWGLYDMHGNVWEWVQDWYDENAYDGGFVRDPQGPSAGETRVLRGGSWGSGARRCRSASRSSDRPGSRYGYSGFRLALSPGE